MESAGAYVYGVTRRPATPVSGTGVADAPVYAVEHGELAALVSDVPGRVRAKRRDLLSHSDVLQSAFAGGTVLPFRFGTVFDDVTDQLLVRRHDELVRLIDDLDGLGEMSLRAEYVEDTVLAEIVRDEPRIAALRGRHGAEAALGEAIARTLAAKRDRESDALLRRLGRLARDVAVDEPRTPYELVRASFLLDRGALPRFERALEEVAAAHAGVATFRCVGPLPPHSFVRLEET